MDKTDNNLKLGSDVEGSAGVPPAVAGATRPRFGEVKIHDRGRLPHWEREGGTYFVTFRLADSLPASVLQNILSEREDIKLTAQQMHRDLSASEVKRIQQLSTRAIEEYLDRGAGACELQQAEIAGEVAHTFSHFDGERYRLFCWCIMPNHVHVVARVLTGWTLPSVVHSWKSFTAKRANSILHRQGTFWQREYYDRLIRDEAEFQRAVEYVLDNPVKAGLRDWRWVWVCGRDAPTTAGGAPAVRDAGGTV